MRHYTDAGRLDNYGARWETPAEGGKCMALGLSLLLIFILNLIDKHSLWRQAIKVAPGLVVLCIIGIGGVYGWGGI